MAVGVPRHDVRPRRARRVGARLPRRERAGRQHDRHVLHRQRPAHEHLAGRRDDAVPQREELQLGGRLPGAGDGALARAHPGGHRSSTASSATTTGSSPCSPRPATPTSPTGSRRRPTSAGRRTRCISTATTSSTTSPVPPRQSPRQHFFYVSDDGDLTALRYDNWKFVFLEQRDAGHAGDLARALHRAAGARRSSTCAPTRTSAPTSRRTPTTTGCSTTPGW